MEGNQQKIREALREAIGETCAGCKRDCDDCMNLKSGWMKKAKAALSAPARQCDVGTAAGQAKRFREFCQAEKCGRYRCRSGCKATCIDRCAIDWAHTPYEAQEGAGE